MGVLHGWPSTNHAHKIYVPEGLSVDWNVNFIPQLRLRRGWVVHVCLCWDPGKRTGTPRPTNQRSTSLSKPSSCPVEQNLWLWTRFGRRGAEVGQALWIRSDNLQQREVDRRSGCFFFRQDTWCVHADVAPARIFLEGEGVGNALLCSHPLLRRFFVNPIRSVYTDAPLSATYVEVTSVPTLQYFFVSQLRSSFSEEPSDRTRFSCTHHYPVPISSRVAPPHGVILSNTVEGERRTCRCSFLPGQY